MLMAKIKITMVVDDGIPEDELNDMADEIDVFNCKLGMMCREFDNANPAIRTTMED